MNKMSREDVSALIKGIIVLVIVAILALLFNIFIKDDGAKASNKYLIVGNYIVFQKTNSGFKQIRELNDDIFDNKYTITNGKDSIKDVTLQFSKDRFYFFDTDYNQIDMPDFRVATKGVSVKLASYERDNLVNYDEYVTNFLKSEGIYDKGYRVSKFSYDFDGDSVVEDIYVLNNYSLVAENNSVKAFMFMVKNNEISKISEIKNSAFVLFEILDINNDGKYEMIVSNNVLDRPTFNKCYLIYSINKDKWTIKNKC